jgi:ABC-type proline/glycine betaine transport system permease subunit
MAADMRRATWRQWLRGAATFGVVVVVSLVSVVVGLAWGIKQPRRR